MDRVIFFVDGFNLYHAIDNLGLKHLKWLNLWALCDSFLSRRETLKDVLYFTAYYPGKPQRKQKHQTYVRALELHNVTPIFGEFKRKNKFCKLCKKYFIGYEEKQTDVNIAIELLKRAVNNEYDTAFIVSGDSDLLPAINATKQTFPDKTIKLLRPPGRGTESLKIAVHQYMKIREKHLTKNQFPNKITKNNLTIERPKDWY